MKADFIAFLPLKSVFAIIFPSAWSHMKLHFISNEQHIKRKSDWMTYISVSDCKHLKKRFCLSAHSLHICQGKMFLVCQQLCEQLRSLISAAEDQLKINLVSCLWASQMSCDHSCFSHIVPNSNPLQVGLSSALLRQSQSRWGNTGTSCDPVCMTRGCRSSWEVVTEKRNLSLSTIIIV